MTDTAEPSHRALERRTMSDSVVDALRDAILDGQFTDGEELNQVALARQFGVSRVPIREALRQLQAEGLVRAAPHMRAVVQGLTLDRVLEVLDLRIMIEGYLLGRAVPLMTDADLDRLDELNRRMAVAPDQQNWLRYNQEFHQALYEPSGAEFALELARQMRGRIHRYVKMRSRSGVERDDEANAEHERITEAVRRGDVERAKLELELHIAHTRDRVVEIFEEIETEGGSGR
jgi:DNA-binding GntR family transcriptional regulator